jgi:glycosyltransferase involved in cell wall biosynthesis
MTTFSIIIPTFNRALFLPRAIQSIQAQSYSNWELIIVDDGSTDNTKEVVYPFLSDTRIRYHYQENAERSAARNKGIGLSKGDFITFMDSDEYMDANRLELLIEGIKKNNGLSALYFTDIRFEFPDSEKNYVRKGRSLSFPVNPNELIETIIGNPQFCATTEVFEKHKFNPHLTVGEDMELLFRISKEYPLIYLENNATITEIEHENRSVNLYSTNVCKQLETTKIMFKKGHPGYEVSSQLKKSMIAGINLRCSYSFIQNNQLLKALIKCIISLLIMPSFQTKHKLLIIFYIATNQINKLLKLIKT